MTGPMREARISASALEHNLRTLRERVGVDVWAVVKANGYGHGSVTAARAALAAGATTLGVADIPEALELRAAGIDAPIVAWLHGDGADFAGAVDADIALGVSSLAQVRAVGAAARAGHPATIHLKVETGLGRNGIAPEQVGVVAREAAGLGRAGILTVAGVFSHLSNTSAADDLEARRAFVDAVSTAREAGLGRVQRHLAASHAALALPETRFDAVRLGIAMYGLSPFPDLTSADLGLTPAMSLRARVAAVRRVDAGHGVSYGYVHRTAHATTLALIPLGYADGVPRAASGSGAVRLGDATFPVAGRIAMDQFVVDVGDYPVAVGDEAVLFGDPEAGDPPVEVWADEAGTINYEIVTRIGSRVPRVEVRE